MYNRWFIPLLLALSLGGVPLAHADFSNGANAIDALGQYDQTSLTAPVPVFIKGGANDGPNRLGYNVPLATAVDSVHHRLFVADYSNNRVLVYALTSGNAISSRIPTAVLGQPNFYANAAATTPRGMRNPYALTYDASGDRLFLSDFGNNRVLVFDVATIANGMAASTVLGQANFTASGTALTQSGMNAPAGTAYDAPSARLFVTDSTNNRVLVFSGATLSNGMTANAVLGQANFTSAVAATSQSGMNFPAGAAYDAVRNRLFVVEYANHRVLVFSGATLSTGMSANTVLGQSSFTTNTFATTRSGFNQPLGIAYDSGRSRLFVSALGNHRILVFSGASLSNGMNANTVIGQPNFTSGAAATTRAGLNIPRGLSYDEVNDHLFVADQSNNRLLVFSGASLSNGMSASDALGQYDDNAANPQPVYTKGAANNGPNQYGYSSVRQFAIDAVHHRLFVADSGNNRVLVYGLTPTNEIASHLPVFVLGQPNFYTRTSATTQSTMNSPYAVAYDAGTDRFFVADTGNSRILVFSGASLSNGMNANTVIGQPNFTSGAAATTRAGMNNPQSLGYDSRNNRLFLVDTNNHRVLVFSGATLSNGMNANAVIGQPNFTTNAAAAGATAQSGLNGVENLAYDGVYNRLFVGQFYNSRVAVFSVSSIVNGMPATAVLGQPDFSSFANGPTQSVENGGVVGVAYNDTTNQIYVGGYNTNRILVFGDTVVTSSSSSSSSAAAETRPSNGGHRGNNFTAPPVSLNTRAVVSSSSSSFSSSSSSLSSAHSSSSMREVGGPPTEEMLHVQMDGDMLIFRDVPAASWFGPYVTTVVQAHVASGYRDQQGQFTGMFGPGNPVTQAEILKMALLAGNKAVDPAAKPRNTSAQGDWSGPYVAEAETLGLSVYTKDRDVRLPATRGQVIQTILEVFGIPTDKAADNPFSDLPADHPQAAAIKTAWKLRIITGDTAADGTPLGSVRPDAPINRAETAKIIATLLQHGPYTLSVSAASSSVAVGTVARVAAAVAYLRADARVQSPVQGVLRQGDLLTVLRVVDVWVQVRLDSGIEGYIAMSKIEPLAP